MRRSRASLPIGVGGSVSRGLASLALDLLSAAGRARHFGDGTRGFGYRCCAVSRQRTCPGPGIMARGSGARRSPDQKKKKTTPKNPKNPNNLKLLPEALHVDQSIISRSVACGPEYYLQRRFTWTGVLSPGAFHVDRSMTEVSRVDWSMTSGSVSCGP